MIASGDLSISCEYPDDFPIMQEEEKRHLVDRQMHQDIERYRRCEFDFFLCVRACGWRETKNFIVA